MQSPKKSVQCVRGMLWNFNLPEPLSFLLLLPFLLLVPVELLLLLLLLFSCGCCCCSTTLAACCSSFARCPARPFGDTALEDDGGDDVGVGDTVSERLERNAPAVAAGLFTNASSPALFTQTVATFGPTVITVGRTRVKAKVEPGSGSRYGGGLRDLIVGRSAEKWWD